MCGSRSGILRQSVPRCPSPYLASRLLLVSDVAEGAGGGEVGILCGEAGFDLLFSLQLQARAVRDRDPAGDYREQACAAVEKKRREESRRGRHECPRHKRGLEGLPTIVRM